MKNIWEPESSTFYNNQFTSFGNTIIGTNYIPDFTIVQFVLHTTNQPFNNALLEELFSYDPRIVINGNLIPTTLEKIKDRVGNGLAFRGNSYEDDKCMTHSSRELIFWDIVNRALNESNPEHCFLYQSKGYGIFGEPWLMWDICFILIKNNNGVLVSCGAWE